MAAEGVSVLALIMCESSTVDPASGARTLNRMFNVVGCRGFPTIIPRMTIFIQLRRVGRTGAEHFVLALVAPSGGNVFAGAILGADWSPDTDGFATVVEHAPVSLPEPGRYLLRVLAADRVVAETTLFARALP